MESMKLLYFVSEFSPYPLAASGRYLSNLLAFFKDHDVTVVTPQYGGTSSQEKVENITIKRIPLPLLRPSKGKKNIFSLFDARLLLAFAVRKYLLQRENWKDIDLVHIMNLIEGTMVDYKSLKKPTIISVNDYYAFLSRWNPLHFPYYSSDFPLRYFHYNFLRSLYPRPLKNCTHLIANTNFTKSQLLKYADSDKVDVVYRGIDTEMYDVGGLNPGKYSGKNVLFIGANMERKGALDLFRAIPLILEKVPDAKFTIVGSATRLFKWKVAKYLQSGNVSWFDYLSPEKTLPYYSKASVFALPAHLETIPQVAIEALASGTPVVCTNVGALPEIIGEEVGKLIPRGDPRKLADSIIELLSHPELAKRMGENGRSKVFNFFTKERMARDTLNVYKNVVH